jgi:AcrR family transcriptional regulator
LPVATRSHTLALTSVRQEAGATSRREEILTAAGTLFAESGYHATSVRDIAGRVGLQAASLYAHVQSKEELLFLIVDRVADEFVTAIVPIAADTARPASVRLRAALHAHLGIVARNLATATVYFHDWRSCDPARRAAIVNKRDMYEAAWRSIVAEGIAAGELAPCDPKSAALAWLSAANWFHAWYRPDGPLCPAALADRMADLLLEGLILR